MIVQSIDLIGGQAVQLRQGKEHVLTDPRPPVELARSFNRASEVAVIDLDAALGQGDNLSLIRQLCTVADVRAGGGIRDVARGQALLKAGARQIIIGTAATPEFLAHFPPERVMVAIDHVDGRVVDHGWTQATEETFLERARRLAPYCAGFLCTFVKDEGGMGGMDLDVLRQLKADCPRPVTVAGGVASTEEAVAISRMGLDVQVGMALYTGKLDPVACLVDALDWEKAPLIPTIVQDELGQVLMLAYSSRESLTVALTTGKGIYYSRSRQELWEKGKTSGHTQQLFSARPDCDRDSLLFTVTQAGPACHTESYSCFGGYLPAPKFSMPALLRLLADRKANPVEGSFTNKMLENRPKLLRKLMEEAFEVTLASHSGDRQELIWELADLLYFASVLAVAEDIPWSALESELAGRHGAPRRG